MLIEISNRNVTLDEKQREWVERRLQFALGRFASRIRRVSVVFSDINGARGGVDKKCRLRVVLIPDDEVIVTDTEASVESVIAMIVDRAARSVARQIERRGDSHEQAERVVVLNTGRFVGDR